MQPKASSKNFAGKINVTRIEIFNALRPIILLTGVPECILAEPNQQAPKGSYAAIEPFQGISEAGTIIRSSPSAEPRTLDISVDRQKRANVWINFYRTNALDYAQKVQGLNWLNEAQNRLFLLKIAWLGTTAVNNLTALQSNKREARAQVALTIGYEVKPDQPEQVNTIEYVDVVEQNSESDTIKTFNVQTDDYAG